MFEVRWSLPANGQLATIWVEATNRGAITTAVETLDRSLRSEPEEQGESRAGRERIVIVPPLVVSFRVSVDDRLVDVLTVRHLRRRGEA